MPPGSGVRLLWRGAMLIALAAASALPAQDTPPRHAYAIPAQRLSRALAHFSEVSGVDVLLDDPRSGERRSAALNGTYSAPQALTVMLAGTGLVARFTSARSAVIVAQGAVAAPAAGPAVARGGRSGAVIELDTMRVTAPRMIGGTGRIPDRAFLSAMAGQIRRIVIDGAVFGASNREQLRIQTRIRGDGTLHDVRIVGPIGDARRDAGIIQLLDGRRLDLAPPADMRQPLMFDVAAR